MKKLLTCLSIILVLTGCEYLEKLETNEESSQLSTNQSQSSIQNTEDISSNNKYIHFNAGYQEWLNATREDKYVVTVFGASYCPHCTKFKPVIESVAEKYNIELYYYYIDELDDEESNKIINSYDTNFEGSVPHMFITKNSNVITNRTGSMDEKSLLEFLELNMVIE